MVAAAVVIAAAAMLYTGPATGPRREAMIGPVPANGVPERVQVSMLCHELLHQHSERSEHRRRHPVPNLCFRSCFALPSARAPLNLPPPSFPSSRSPSLSLPKAIFGDWVSDPATTAMVSQAITAGQ